MNKNTLLKISYFGAIVLLIAIFAVFILEKSQVIDLYQKPLTEQVAEERGVNDIDYSPSDPTENEEINTKKESGQIVEEPSQPEPGEPINVVLTAATQDNPGGPVVVRVLLTDVSSGTCNISLSKDDTTLSYTRNVVNAGTYFNCEALDIPFNELGYGTWSLTVNVTNGDRVGNATQKVEVKQ